MKPVILYTDGASRGNPGKGGWGVVLIYGKAQKELKGYSELATNNQMELLAAIKGLEELKVACDVTLYTDSQYVVSGVTQWMTNWKKNNWRTSNKQPVKNKELWQRLEELSQFHQVHWQWVKGHSGNNGNELADELANQAIDEHEANA